MQQLAGKTAVITGAGSGIGRALALKLASEGASVVVNDLDEAQAAEAVAAVAGLGGKAVACVGDVTAPDFGERFVPGYKRPSAVDMLFDAPFKE